MRYLNFFWGFVKEIIQSRALIIELAKKDFQKKYLGSYLGIIWGFIQPLINILIFWFVFQVGFKSTPISNFPFILWLMCGMIPWFFFADAIGNATNAFTENSYLLKNIVFKISVLPIVKVLSSLYVHLFFILFLFVMFIVYHYVPNLYYLQVFYYLFATVVLVLSLSLVTSTIMVFVKDTTQIVAMFLQIFFWLTPIFWDKNVLPAKFRFMLIINPMNYIVEGYRNTFIYHKWFWEDMRVTLVYWGITFVVFIIGVFLFKRLKPHFADII
jgi:ABC-type polysaccharide/polyol phosphate export permease